MELTPQLRATILGKIKTLINTKSDNEGIINRPECADIRDMLSIENQLISNSIVTLEKWIIENEADF